ncbi:conserved hypothetical protein [Nitrospira lenta]|uniref:Uncharacterized protein n=1 Tax=Nitrospira lenta TaxID=1436998 RepID=A0A330LAS1_9BACT|nr:conserved hypothetical protein [Nitrospira lenta]
MLAQTIIIPTLSVSETYDSNVFYTPKTLLGPGFKAEDFMTTVRPQINLAHAGPRVNGSFSVGANITKYVNNPSLDYTGINVAGQLDLKRWANSFSQRISALSVRGTYQFTPSLSGFGATTGGAFGTGYGSTGISSPIDTGLVTNRVSMHNMNFGVTGGYDLTRNTVLTASYSYTKLTFGNQSGGINNQLFDTDGHTTMTALTTKISPTDTVGTTATMSHYIQGGASGGGSGSFTTISGTANWAKLWTKQLSTSLGGGGIFTLPIESTVPGQSIKSTFAPTGTITMTYSSFSEGLREAGAAPGPFDNLPRVPGSLAPGGVIAPGAFTTSLSYNFSIFPSYALNAGPMKTHVVGVNANMGITSKLTGQAGMNYSHGNSSISSFDTLGATAGASYLLGPVLVNLTYNWLHFSNSFAQSAVAQSEYAFSKKMVMLSLSYAFTSQSFFRMGGMGSFASQETGESAITPAGTGAGSGSVGSGVLKKE